MLYPFPSEAVETETRFRVSESLPGEAVKSGAGWASRTD